MKESIQKIVGVTEKLEKDFGNMDSSSPRSIEMIKDRAHQLVMVLGVSKNQSLNAQYLDVLNGLEQRAIRIISQLE